MSNTVSELIGRMVNAPAAPVEPPAAAPRALAAQRPSEPLHVLIGRIIHPYGEPVVSQESAAVASAPEGSRELEPVIAS